MSQHETDIVVIRFYSTWCKVRDYNFFHFYVIGIGKDICGISAVIGIGIVIAIITFVRHFFQTNIHFLFQYSIFFLILFFQVLCIRCSIIS
jgi:hypothetical protein